VGIGTTSPTYSLDVRGEAGLEIYNASGGGDVLNFRPSLGDANKYNMSISSYDHSGGGVGPADGISINAFDGVSVATGSSTARQERMRIDSSGNVGIGTSSPSAPLDVDGSGTGIDLANFGGSAQTNFSKVNFNTDALSNQAYIIAYGSGNAESGNVAIKNTNSSGDIFFTAGNAERARIDSSGNLLVGKTVTSEATVGHTLGNTGYGYATANSGICYSFNRLSSDGEILRFRKDTSTVGSIGVQTGDLTIGNSDTGLKFHNSSNMIIPWNLSTNAGRDNAIDLGGSGNRFDDIYATNGTIQTSDRNEKQDIAELSEAEQRVAVACKGLLRKFRWKDSVAEKGDDARIHFGIIAQDLQAAFEAEGLDAGDYAMFISTTWTDEETNEEKTRMGVRYSELLAFIISAI
jgi:hypothetical protein